MNVEAERMIESFIWRRLLPAMIVLGAGAAAIIFLVR
jgi:hypothetical protein